MFYSNNAEIIISDNLETLIKFSKVVRHDI